MVFDVVKLDSMLRDALWSVLTRYDARHRACQGKTEWNDSFVGSFQFLEDFVCTPVPSGCRAATRLASRGGAWTGWGDWRCRGGRRRAPATPGSSRRPGPRLHSGKAHALTCLLVEISTAPRTRSREVAGDAEGRCQGAAGVWTRGRGVWERQSASEPRCCSVVKKSQWAQPAPRLFLFVLPARQCTFTALSVIVWSHADTSGNGTGWDRTAQGRGRAWAGEGLGTAEQGRTEAGRQERRMVHDSAGLHRARQGKAGDSVCVCMCVCVRAGPFGFGRLPSWCVLRLHRLRRWHRLAWTFCWQTAWPWDRKSPKES